MCYDVQQNLYKWHRFSGTVRIATVSFVHEKVIPQESRFVRDLGRVTYGGFTVMTNFLCLKLIMRIARSNGELLFFNSKRPQQNPPSNSSVAIQSGTSAIHRGLMHREFTPKVLVYSCTIPYFRKQWHSASTFSTTPMMCAAIFSTVWDYLRQMFANNLQLNLDTSKSCQLSWFHCITFKQKSRTVSSN